MLEIIERLKRKEREIHNREMIDKWYSDDREIIEW